MIFGLFGFFGGFFCFVLFSLVLTVDQLAHILKIHCAYHLNEKSIIIDCVLSIIQFAQSSFKFSVCLTPYMQLFILLMARSRR